MTEAIVSGVAGLRSKTISPVARSATAIETPDFAAGGRNAAISSAERQRRRRPSSCGSARRAARRGAGGAAWSAATRRYLRAALVTLQIIIDRLRFDEESRVFEISVRELAEDEGFRRVGFDRGDGWRRLGLGSQIHARVLAERQSRAPVLPLRGPPRGPDPGRGLDRRPHRAASTAASSVSRVTG